MKVKFSTRSFNVNVERKTKQNKTKQILSEKVREIVNVC